MIRVVLGGALLLGLTLPIGIATSASPDDAAACRQKLDNAKAKIDHDAAKYGENSDRVAHDRDDMEKARQWCRDHKADWDHNTFDVGIYVRK